MRIRPYREEQDILHAIISGYEYDGLLPQDWAEVLFRDSDLFADTPLELKLEMIRHLAKDERFKELILNQLNSFL
jgi:hypothetical protein